MTSAADFLARLSDEAGRLTYIGFKHRLVGWILCRARLGVLDSDWRDRLTTDPLFQAPSDTAALVHRELVDLPVQPWEPYIASGDWREALDAWYSDALAVETSYEETLFSGRPRPPAEPEAGNDWLARYAAVQAQQTALDNRARQNLLRTRDGLGASYRAGLAAGGVKIDWEGWYWQRVASWDDLGERGLQVDGRRTRLPCVEHLPLYWLRATL